MPKIPSSIDDTLKLLFLCCHPAVSPPSQVALTLRAVGGLTTAQIASAFLVPEATMARRITRAKESIAAAGSTASVWTSLSGARRSQTRTVSGSPVSIWDTGRPAASTASTRVTASIDGPSAVPVCPRRRRARARSAY